MVILVTAVQDFWPKLTGLKWLHSGAVGLEHLLTPALVCRDVVLTNARSVYSHSLSE
jgi:phosphoglycerate dehydrogenase-like enzyme